jgi:alkylation response protein AidB-like acyl-CoA dehydrogenase
MRFALSAEQSQFAKVLRESLEDADVPAAARRWAAGDPEPGFAVWKRLADLGVTALAVPESAGGLDAHPVDLVVAFEELGRSAMPGPVVESLAVAPVLLAGICTDQDGLAGQEGHARLAGLASGELLASVVAPPHVPLALDADVAGLVLELAEGSVRTAEPTDPVPSIDPARRLFGVRPTRTLAEHVPEVIARAFALGVLACAAQLVGAGEGLLAASVAHARTREQFGRPIGEFQAVAHRLADVRVGLEIARPLVHAAALAWADHAGTVTRDVAAAKVAAGQAAHRAARAALQVHGALGYTREHDVSLWLPKVRALDACWGTRSFHRARIRETL